MVYLLYLSKLDLKRLNNLQQVQQMFLLQGLKNVLKFGGLLTSDIDR